MPVVAGSSGWALRLVLVAVMVATGWAGMWYVRHRDHTVEAQDGTFKVTYSSYWDEMDTDALPPVPGFSPDLAVDNEKSGVLIMHMPAPPGSEETLMKSLNPAQLEQVLASSPWPGTLESSSTPGTTTVAGKTVTLEAKASVDYQGFDGKLDLLVTFSPDQSVLLMIIHGCQNEECSTSSAEFKEVLDSIEFTKAPPTAL
jgi:hypothetical protein